MSGAVLVESKSEVLEDTVEALLPKPKVEDGEEFVDLHKSEPKLEAKAEVKPEAKSEAKLAVKKPESKPAAETEGELPEELRGKTPAQIAKMYRDAQSLIGRQGSELGDLRKRVDYAIQASLASLNQRKEPASEKKPEPAVIDESEIFAKPIDAISKMIENHPVIKEIRATMGKTAADQATSRAQAATERFNQAHPDASEILGDPEFRQWVSASRVRTGLLQRAHSAFDFDAGDEVFSTWKALKGAKAQPKPTSEVADAGQPDEAAVRAAAQVLARASAAKKAKDATAQAAAAPTGGASAGKEPASKKIYRRADVLRLMEEDPNRYEAMAPEIEQAYRDGRVR